MGDVTYKDETYKYRHTLDAPNEEAYQKMLFILKELGITEEEIEATDDDI